MDRPFAHASRLVVLAAALLAAGAPVAQAQTAAVGGAQLQTWLDQKFTYAGLHHGSGCYLLNTADAQGRVLFLACPNGWSAKIPGSARVQGDMLCTNFPVPNSAPGDECLTWHKAGDNLYEQRDAKGVNTSLYLLAPLKAAERIVSAMAALMLVAALPVTDEIGFVMAALFFGWHIWQKRRLAMA